MKQLLKVEKLQKIYISVKSDLSVIALNNIDFTVQTGEFLGIMGASGSGKTTLLNCLSTIDTVTSGKIFIDGVEITSLSEAKLARVRKEKIGFIFQEFNLLDILTARENIELPLIINKVKPELIQSLIKELAIKLNIESILDKFPHEISGGQRQKVACARAMINKPSLVFADEPTGSLDSKSATTLMQTFKKMNEELNSTILLVTHDPFSASYCKRILFLKDGKIQNEIFKGDKSDREFFDEILACQNLIGERI